MGIVNGLGIRSFSSVKVKVLLRELHIDHHPRFFLWAQGGKYSNIYKANVHWHNYGSCRFWQRTDSQPGSSMHGLKSGSCRFWQRTDLQPGSRMLRAEIQRALRRAPRQLRRLARLANSPGFKSFRCHVGESNSRSNAFQIRHKSVCVPSRWKVLSGEFRRRPTAFANKISQIGSCRSPRTV